MDVEAGVLTGLSSAAEGKARLSQYSYPKTEPDEGHTGGKRTGEWVGAREWTWCRKKEPDHLSIIAGESFRECSREAVSSVLSVNSWEAGRALGLPSWPWAKAICFLTGTTVIQSVNRWCGEENIQDTNLGFTVSAPDPANLQQEGD